MNAYRLVTVFLLFILFQACKISGTDITEILWDEWGVPHIYAHTTTGLFYATGWAQMESHGDLILRLYGEARGRAAQYWGEDYIDSDRWVRTVGIPHRAHEWFRLQSDEFKEELRAFTDGMNEYADANPHLIDDSLKKVLPVTPEDVLAHVQRVLHFTFISNPAIVPAMQRRLSAGSNVWAVAPPRTESGNALLLINPHLAWSESLFRFYEMHLVMPGLNIYGATLVGMPVIVLGFNEYLGWAHTVNTIDAADAYLLTLADGGYLFDGKIHPFEEFRDTILISDSHGNIDMMPFTIRKSVHGPVIAQHGNRAVALRVAGLDAPYVVDQWWNMARAKNLDDFITQLKRMQLPMFTVMYADRGGNIFHFFAGQVPVRETGDWSFWQGLISGDTSLTLWTDTHSFDELPLVKNPPTGWLQNANDPPWTTTFPPQVFPEDYPPYMAPVEFGLRAQESARMLMENETLSFDHFIELTQSTRMNLADRILDDLIEAINFYGSDTGKRAAEVLSSWDRNSNADGRGAVLFAEWARNYNIWRNFKTPFNLENPFETPSGLADPQGAVRELERTAVAVENAYGSIDVSWGEVYRLIIDEYDFPASGGPGNLGIFNVLGFETTPSENNRFRANFGNSFIAVIEFSKPLRAQVLTTYGNATQRHLVHRGDQLELHTVKEMRNALLTRKEIEEITVKKIVIEEK